MIEELAIGFLFTEGIITGMHQIRKVTTAPVRQKEARGNVIVVELAAGLEMDYKKLEKALLYNLFLWCLWKDIY